jgi:predicted RNase H-like HicB family nuclease
MFGKGMVAPMKTFTVVYERDEANWWVADVPDVPGCHTQGRTVEEARERILDALSLYVNDANQILLHEEARLPQSAA